MLSTMLDGDEGDVVGRSTGGVRATVGPARQKRVLLSLHGSRYGHLAWKWRLMNVMRPRP